MVQTNVNIRMDEDLKKQFDAFCSDIGMNMTTAFCVFAKAAVRERRIPFEISPETDPFYRLNGSNRWYDSRRGSRCQECGIDDVFSFDKNMMQGEK